MGMTGDLKLLVLLAVSAFTIMFLTYPQFTGWVTDTLNISISIASTAQGCMNILSNQSMAAGSENNFSVYLENCGNQMLNGRISLVVGNSSGVVWSMNSTEYSLGILQSFSYNFTWQGSNITGPYYVTAADNYTNETIKSNITFDVVTCVRGSYRCFDDSIQICEYDWVYYMTCSYGCQGGACKSAPGRAPLIPQKGFSVEAPARVELYSGSKLALLIKVVNRGTAPIDHLSLDVRDSNISLRTEPGTVALPLGSSVIFFVELNANNTEPGDYVVSWTLTGDETKKHGNILVTVLAAPIEQECKESVNHYMLVMDKLKEQINVLDAEGKNVTRPRELFQEALYELMAAQTYYKIGSHTECIDRIGIVRSYVEQIVIELAHAKPEPIMLILPVVYQMVFWAVVSVIAVVLTMFVFRRMLGHRQQTLKKKHLVLPKDWD